MRAFVTRANMPTASPWITVTTHPIRVQTQMRNGMRGPFIWYDQQDGAANSHRAEGKLLAALTAEDNKPLAAIVEVSTTRQPGAIRVPTNTMCASGLKTFLGKDYPTHKPRSLWVTILKTEPVPNGLNF